MEEGAGGVGEARGGDGEALANLDGRGVVVDAEEDEAHGAVNLWTAENWLAAQTARTTREDEAGEIDGAASAKTGVAADVDHRDVDEPHGEGEKDFGIAEVGWADGGLGDERADEQAGGHAGQAEEERLEGDLVGSFQGRERRQGGGFLFQAAFLNEVEQRGEE